MRLTIHYYHSFSTKHKGLRGSNQRVMAAGLTWINGSLGNRCRTISMLDVETLHAPAELRTIRLKNLKWKSLQRGTPRTTFFPFVICEFKYAKNWLNQQMED